MWQWVISQFLIKIKPKLSSVRTVRSDEYTCVKQVAQLRVVSSPQCTFILRRGQEYVLASGRSLLSWSVLRLLHYWWPSEGGGCRLGGLSMHSNNKRWREALCNVELLIVMIVLPVCSFLYILIILFPLIKIFTFCTWNTACTQSKRQSANNKGMCLKGQATLFL